MKKPRIVALSGPEKGLEHAITEEPLTIGRDPGNIITLDDALASRRHCSIRLEMGRAVLTDLETRSGTFVNGRAYLTKILDHGDRIKVGSTIFLYLELEDAGDFPEIAADEIDQNRRLETLRPDYSVRGEEAIRDRQISQSLLHLIDSLEAVENTEDARPHLLDLAFEVVPARRGALLLNGHRIGPEPSDFAAEIYRERDFDGSARFSLSARVMAEVYARREAVMTNNVTPVLCVPLITNGVMRGVIYLEGTDGGTPFQPEHLHLLRRIAIVSARTLNIARRDDERVLLREKEPADYEIIGQSPAIQRLLEDMRLAAQVDAPVLIIGESGTGKELVARGIHALSERAGNLFVPVSCPAVVESLFESQFFGHAKGSFTGATDNRKGKFEVANGGTLFLDEIGELKLDMQPKLLRVLQDQRFEPVGVHRTMKVDVRVIAATNVDLDLAVLEKKFRLDLLYRLDAIRIEVPPLRERREDIPLLAAWFMKKHPGRRGVTEIAPEAMEALMAYDFPGNVRELEQAIVRATAMARNPPVITADDLRERIIDTTRKARNLQSAAAGAAKQARHAEATRVFIECGRDPDEAARRLDVTKRYLYRLLEPPK